MAISVSQLGSASNKGTSTTLTSTSSSPLVTDEYIIAIFASDGGTVTGISHPYATLGTLQTAVTASNSGNVITKILYARVTAGHASSGSVQLTGLTSGDAKAAAFFRVSGLHPTAPFDKSATSTGSTANASVGPTNTLATADQVGFAGIGFEDKISDVSALSWTTGSGYISDIVSNYAGTSGSGDASNISVVSCFELLSATTAQSAQYANAACDWAAAIATFKADPTGIVTAPVASAFASALTPSDIGPTKTVVDYYFNGYSAGSTNWTGLGNIVDNSDSTYGIANVSSGILTLTSNTCPGTDLGTITKLEFGAHIDLSQSAIDNFGFELVINNTQAWALTSYINDTWEWVEVFPGSFGRSSFSWADIAGATCYVTPSFNLSDFLRLHQVRLRVTYIAAQTGTQYTQSVSGSTTASGGIVRQAGKLQAGSITFAGVPIRLTGKTNIGSSTATGTPKKQANKGVSGSSTGVGALLKRGNKLVSGSTTGAGAPTKIANKGVSGSSTFSGVASKTRVIMQAVAGSITAVGGLFRQTGKMVSGIVTGTAAALKRANVGKSGSVTATGTPKKQANKGVSGSSTGVGALLKLGNKLVSGSVTATGTQTKRANKGVSGSSTGIGALLKRGNKLVSGSVTGTGTPTKRIRKEEELEGAITPTGKAIKQTLKSVIGTITVSGFLEALRTAGMFAQAVGGSITASGGIVRLTSKNVAGSVTGVGVAIKRAARGLAGSLTPSGAIIKSARRLFSGSVTASGALLKAARKGVAGTITTTGALVRRVSKGVSGSVTASGVVARVKKAVLSLAGSLTPLGSVTRRAAKSLAGSVISSGDAVRTATYRRLLAGAITATGAVRAAREFLLGLPNAPLVPWGIRVLDWLLAPLVAAMSALTELAAPTVPEANQVQLPGAVDASGSVSIILPAAPGTPIIDARQDLQAPTVAPVDGVEHVEPPDVNGVQKL